MGSKWCIYRLGDIAEFSYGKMPKKEFVGTGDYVIFSGYKYTESYPEKNTSAGELIVVARGVGGTGDVKITTRDCYLTNLSIKINLDETKVRKEYFYYLFLQSNLRYLDSGSAQSQITINDLANVEISAPSLNVQDLIVKSLKAFDDKITTLSSMNQTLEQMSQTLFKSWFVDFDPVIDNALDAGNPIPEALQTRAKLRQKVRNSADFKPLPAEIRSLFPSEFEETELGWVPKSWNISLAGEEFIVKGGSTPSTANEDFWINGTIYWTSPKDLTGNQSKVLLDTAKKITPLGLTKISSGLLPVNTVLMSSRAPIGYLAINKVPMAINQGYIAIPSAKHLSPEFTIYWLENIMDDIKGIAGGTTFAEISKSAFKTIKLLIPSSDIITEFSRVTRNHFDKVVQNTKEIDLLTNLRDTLLPKLISGELSLEDLPDLTTDTEAA